MVFGVFRDHAEFDLVVVGGIDSPAAAAAAFMACDFEHSVLLLFPFGAGFILGVYVTVLVTTSLMCRTLLFEALVALQSCE